MSAFAFAGAIAAHEDDRVHLESMGIRLGVYSRETGVFHDCVLSDHAMERLLEEPQGRYSYNLTALHIASPGELPSRTNFSP